MSADGHRHLTACKDHTVYEREKGVEDGQDVIYSPWNFHTVKEIEMVGEEEEEEEGKAVDGLEEFRKGQ